MMRLVEIRNRLRALFVQQRIDRDLEEEMRFHVEMRAREYVEAGMSKGEATRAAERAFGNRLLAREDSRRVWSFALIETFVQDLRYGVRTLLRNPLFSGASILTLALGIGANTAIFTLLDVVVLRALPVERPRELYVFGTRVSGGSIQTDGVSEDGVSDRDTSLFSYPLFQDFREHDDVFATLAAVSSYSIKAYLSPDVPSRGSTVEIAEARLVSGRFFETLGVRAFRGRTIGPADNQVPGGHPVAVVSHAFWARHFGSSPDALGRQVHLNGTLYTVLGVTPPEFRGATVGSPTDIWVPLAMQAELERGERHLADRNVMWLRIIGRLPEPVSPELAAERTNALFHRLLVAEAGTEVTPQGRLEIERLTTHLTPFARGFGGLSRRFSRPLMVLMVVVGLVLLIACANVGNLLLARASSRQKEVAVRLALGASRRRLVRQLLTESLLLALLGGALGILVAHWILGFLLSLIVSGPSLAVGLDSRVLAFTFSVSVATALLFGLIPARRATRLDLDPALKSQRLISGRKAGGFPLRQGLVVSQVALSLLLLIVAGLFLRSLQNLRGQDLGFRPEGVLIVEIDPQGGGYSLEEVHGLYRDLVETLESLPGVESASLSLFSPLARYTWRTEVSVDGYSPPTAEAAGIQATFVTPGYLQTLGVSLLGGREPDENDRMGAPKVAMVNETFARQYFGTESPVGRRFGVEGEESSRETEIVGLVPDLKIHDLREETPRLVYFPAAQHDEYLYSLQVHARSELSAGQVRDLIARVAPGLPITGVRSLDEQVERSLGQERLLGQLTAFFGLLALLLAAVGLYGVLAYSVSQRTNEIGIRMALGAEPSRMLGTVLGSAMRWVGAGVVIGLAAALAASRFLSGLLFGLDPIDPPTLLVTTGALVLVASLAAYGPARRASRLDPVSALRHE
ncbi:MAG: ABC transporter permease [Acidobacteria bacterium]|nr:ABC transporter permease [Acidobacteriota bacterium]